MTNFKGINELRGVQQALRELTHNAYTELASTDKPSDIEFSLNGLDIIAEKTISKIFRLISPNLSEINRIENDFKEKPTRRKANTLVLKSRELLQKKLNSDAVRILSMLVNKHINDAIIILGGIFMNGVKNRLGKFEFKHPQNAVKCLTIGAKSGNLESTYLLGVLFRSFGQNKKAKDTFFHNMKNGCVKSTAEFIIMLQIEAAATSDDRQRAIIVQKIKNLRADNSYTTI